MKLKSLLIGALLLTGTINVFASNGAVSRTKNASVLAKSSCTVSVKTSTRSVTITVDCDCTQKGACNQAYAIATLGMK